MYGRFADAGEWVWLKRLAPVMLFVVLASSALSGCAAPSSGGDVDSAEALSGESLAYTLANVRLVDSRDEQPGDGFVKVEPGDTIHVGSVSIAIESLEVQGREHADVAQSGSFDTPRLVMASDGTAFMRLGLKVTHEEGMANQAATFASMTIGDQTDTTRVGEYEPWDPVAGQHQGGTATDILQQIKDPSESGGETVEDHYAVEGVFPAECILGNDRVTVEMGFTDDFPAAKSLVDIESPESVEDCPYRYRVVLGYEFEGL